MREPLEVAVSALKQIIDCEVSANNGWNGLNNATSIARRALREIEAEHAAIDRMIETEIDHAKHPDD